jgi:DNA-binding PadR family transcriptional regulator
MELFMSGCISVNYGAIYPLLKRLEERGFIQVFNEQEDNNNPRKMYSITPEGREKWREKMLEHPQESWINSRSRFMIKYFFFSYLQPQERLKLLEHRFMTCKLYLEKKELDFDFVCHDPYQLEAWNRCKWAIINEIDWLEIQIANVTKTLFLGKTFSESTF